MGFRAVWAMGYLAPVRILIASRTFPPDAYGSASTVLHHLWQRLRREHEVELVCGWTRDPSLLPSAAKAVEIQAFGPLQSRFRLDLAVRKAALLFRPEVVLAHGTEVPTSLRPTVTLLADPFSSSRDWNRLQAVRDKVVRDRIQAARIALAPSEAARKQLEDNGVRHSRLRVAWPGVDTTRFLPDPSVPPLPRSAADGPIRLLYAARMIPGKGQHVAIEAVKGLPARLRRRVVLDLVGPAVDSGYLSGLKRRAADAPVDFHLQVPDLVPWYRKAHIVLFPTTIDEVFGYSAVDGMACGKPVIFSRCAALVEVTGGVGVGVGPGDVKQLSDAIRALIREPDRCEALGEEGRKLVVERYSWERAEKRYIDALEEAAG